MTDQRVQPMAPARTRWGRALRAVRGRDDGQIMILSIGFMALALVLIAVITTVTAIQLDRNRLWNLADDSARFAAGSIDLDSFYIEQPQGSSVPISDSSVRRAVDEYLALAPPDTGSLGHVHVTQAATPDGRTAVVVLESVSQPAMLTWLLRTFADSEGVAIRVESSARAW